MTRKKVVQCRTFGFFEPVKNAASTGNASSQIRDKWTCFSKVMAIPLNLK